MTRAAKAAEFTPHLDQPLTAAQVFADLLRVPEPGTGKLIPLVIHPAQADLLAAFDAIDPATNLPRYTTLAALWPKKAGKSATGAGLALADLIGNAREVDREVLLLASDFEQARNAVFAALVRFVQRNKWLAQHVKISKSEAVYKQIVTDARTGGRHVQEHILRALPARDYKSLHGSNATCLVLDEMWSFETYDLIEALARSPSRICPRVVVLSYAGLKSQKRIGHPLWDLELRWRAGTDPALFVSHLSGMDCYRGIPWMTPRFLEEQRAVFAAVPSKFERLYRNLWSSSDAGAFLTEAELIDATDPTLAEATIAMPGIKYGIGVDLGLTHDLTGVVVSHVDAAGRLIVDAIRYWRGAKGRPVDLMAVEHELVTLARRFHAQLHLDAWQGVLLQQRLTRQGVSAVVHTIELSRLDAYASLLKTLFIGRQIRVPAHTELLQQLETVEGEETRRDRIRFTSGPGGYDDLVMSLCLSWEPLLKWKTQDGKVTMARTELGRPRMAEINGCYVTGYIVGAQYPEDFCPLVVGGSIWPGCRRCASYQSVIAAIEAEVQAGGPRRSLFGMASMMVPSQVIRDLRAARVDQLVGRMM